MDGGEKTAALGSGGSSANEVITGGGQADLASHAFSISLNQPAGGSVEIVWSGGIEYVRVPTAQRSTVPGHKPWVSVNMDKMAQAGLHGSSSQLAAPNSCDPAQALAQLAAVSSGVSKVGAATVAGVPATEYRAQVSLDKLTSQVRAMYGAGAAEGVRQEEQKLGASLPVEVWVVRNTWSGRSATRPPSPQPAGAALVRGPPRRR